MADEISSSDDFFDSRDVDARIDELETDAEIHADEPDYLDDIIDELEKLKTFRDDVTHPEWQYGLTFINEDHFEDYARQFAEEVGAISADAAWPANCIDWEQAAEQLRMDYTSVTFDGTTFYHRS